MTDRAPESQRLESLARAIREGDRRALSRAITLVESVREDHRHSANTLLEHLMGAAGGAIRIGVSGAPGVGKSTFIDALGCLLCEDNHRVAVLTVDPSSAISGGSILGDKTRMEALARQPNAYIRPSPAGATLGGVALRSRECLLLCEAAGYDVVIVETVGVGQSETRVADMTDTFVLLLQPGGGDELQGIKRGIMELADLVLVNKADDEMVSLAERSAADYRNALHLIQARTPGWKVEVQTCSARDGTGLESAWNAVLEHRKALDETGELQRVRAEQAHHWMWTELLEQLQADLRNDKEIKKLLPGIETAVREERLPTAVAAAQLLEAYRRRD